ncbi:bZIP transcription factor 44 [Sesamum alatum]|uniref:BZIP transcription factor 44 n=1 Tax=Sesamum alatum TaxID=300844 RepID=A0AAE2CU31_9LAMI|nr:bZIP transcription factor 44 [Sesamum alatum]
MASSCVTSSGSPHPGSHEVVVVVMDERKRKRMQSNRESARRSRLRKQKHLDDLMNCISLLSKENSQVLTRIHLIKQQHLKLEAENSVLRAQFIHLTKTLQSLKDICISSTTPRPPPPPPAAATACLGISNFSMRDLVDGFLNHHPWNMMMGPNCQYHYPVMASAEMLDY